jgi:hypothetical protein
LFCGCWISFFFLHLFCVNSRGFHPCSFATLWAIKKEECSCEFSQHCSLCWLKVPIFDFSNTEFLDFCFPSELSVRSFETWLSFWPLHRVQQGPSQWRFRVQLCFVIVRSNILHTWDGRPEGSQAICSPRSHWNCSQSHLSYLQYANNPEIRIRYQSPFLHCRFFFVDLHYKVSFLLHCITQYWISLIQIGQEW